MALVTVLMMMVMFVPSGALNTVFDSHSETELSVSPYIENENPESDKLNPDDASVDAGTVTEDPVINVNPPVDVEVPITPTEDLPVEETTPTEEVEEGVVEIPIENESEGKTEEITEETPKQEESDPVTDPDTPLEHIGDTGETVEEQEPKQEDKEESDELNDPSEYIPEYEQSIIFVQNGQILMEWNVAIHDEQYHSTPNKKTQKMKVDMTQFNLVEGTNWHLTEQNSASLLSYTFDMTKPFNMYVYAY